MNNNREIEKLIQAVVIEEAFHSSINKAIRLKYKMLHSDFAFNPVRRISQITGWIYSLESWRYTVGILVADYEQQIAREYILNYVNLFNRESDKYIDFYLPGYVQTFEDDNAFAIGDSKYKFDRELFDLVISDLKELCGIKYGFCPLLILQEFENGGMTDKRIVIELNTEKAGLLFEEIFSLAHREVSIEAFSEELKKAQLKRLFPQIIKESIKKLTGNTFIKIIVDNTDGLTRYSIKERKE